VENYQVPKEKVCVIGEGAEPPPMLEKIESLRREFRQTWGIPLDAVVFAIVGIIRGEKGHREFVEAAFRVLEKHPEACFVIVGQGKGGHEEELACIDRQREKTREAKDPRYHHQLIFTGFYQEIAGPFSAADVVVIPSYTEAQSKVGPEAMMFGRAVIASRVGGLPEIIEHDKTGLLIAPKNINELTGAMALLMENPALRERLAKAGQIYAQANLRFDQRMEELVGCYQACLKK
jgi:glycosyltransferase involved in cell wall biosynthesis